MRVTKRQLRRIIREEKTRLLREQPAPAGRVPITQQNYDEFVENIESGLGWIDPDDVKRQWELMGLPDLSPAAVSYLIELLESRLPVGRDVGSY